MEVTLMLHGSKKIIKHKVGLLNLAEELGLWSKTFAFWLPSVFHQNYFVVSDIICHFGGIVAKTHLLKLIHLSAA